MRKGDRTRDRIVRQTGALFNRFGYRSTPMSAVMKATGLQKGGLYGHFRSKKDLAIETFRFNLGAMDAYLDAARIPADGPVEELRLLLSASIGVAAGKAVPGGCPVLNAAVESDDAFPSLRKEVIVGADGMRATILDILRRARETGSLRPDVDLESASYLLLAAVEGGIMLATLHGESGPLEAVLRELDRIIDGFLERED